MAKREMIEETLEKALEPLVARWRDGTVKGSYIGALCEGLSEQAIVIECEVEHTFDPLDGEEWTVLHIASDITHNLFYEGHIGTPGKAIAIIVPLEKKDEKD